MFQPGTSVFTLVAHGKSVLLPGKVPARLYRSFRRMTLNPDDVKIAHALAHEVPEWGQLDADMMSAFIRAYRNYEPRLQQTVQYVRRVVQWRSSLHYDVASCLRDPPAGRTEFEAMYQAGPVGRDAAGRAVVVERIGRIPPVELCMRFSAEDVVHHTVYNREAAIALNRTLSAQSGRLVQSITPVIDLNGLGWRHLSRDFMSRTKVMRILTPSPSPQPQPD